MGEDHKDILIAAADILENAGVVYLITIVDTENDGVQFSTCSNISPQSLPLALQHLQNDAHLAALNAADATEQ